MDVGQSDLDLLGIALESHVAIEHRLLTDPRASCSQFTNRSNYPTHRLNYPPTPSTAVDSINWRQCGSCASRRHRTYTLRSHYSAPTILITLAVFDGQVEPKDYQWLTA